MTENHDILFSHVARTLPETNSERRELINALTCVLPAEHPAQSTLSGMLSAMALQDELQARLPLAFTQGGAK